MSNLYNSTTLGFQKDGLEAMEKWSIKLELTRVAELQRWRICQVRSNGVASQIFTRNWPHTLLSNSVLNPRRGERDSPFGKCNYCEVDNHHLARRGIFSEMKILAFEAGILVQQV